MTTETWFHGFREYNQSRNYPYVRHTPRVRKVYCITEGWGFPIKIGITVDLKSRHQALRSSTWRDTYFCWSCSGTIDHEAAIKRILRPFLVRCEWFFDEADIVKRGPQGADINDLEAFIEALAERAGRPVFILPKQTLRRTTPMPLLFAAPVVSEAAA